MEERERRPLVPLALIVLATQAPYLFFTPGKHQPEVWPFYGLAAGLLAFLLARPDTAADAGITTRGVGRGLVWLLALLAAWSSGVALGIGLGIVEVSEGVDRSTPDLLVPFVARIALLLVAAIFGDELAWRGVLQSEATERLGRWRAIALVAVLSALYRLPLLVRSGLIDDVPIGVEVYARELLRAVTLCLLFDRTRNLWVVGVYAFTITAVPTLLVGNAEDPFEPLRFYSGHGPVFVALRWMGEVLPVLMLAIAEIRANPSSCGRSRDP